MQGIVRIPITVKHRGVDRMTDEKPESADSLSCNQCTALYRTMGNGGHNR
ncbi:hypothetical protein AB65_2655 [Escherichia coli 2-460-02_S1_C3]|nr:hypothetical protein HMPREF9553_03838 [Escherichia coli MS 200-1]KEJ39589.1 hypothetical protein AB65_2655 [Escherichia coli 2-460-02_S1_C3]